MIIDMNFVIETMTELLKIPSPVGDTYEASEKTAEYLKKLGLKVEYTKKDALVATLKGKDSTKSILISAHIDTLGAMVKEIKDNGRLKLSNLGGFSWGSIEGENCIITTMDDKEYTGTILPEKASVHVFGDEAKTGLRTEDSMEVRIDEDTTSKKETESLNIAVGDYVSFEPRTTITNNGYIKSRHLDDKACVAIVLGFIKYIKDNDLQPKNDLVFYISNFEEICHGVSVFPENAEEFIALDIGTCGGKQTSDEHSVTIVAKDFKTPYTKSIVKNMTEIAKENNISYKIDVHNRYGSDASAAVLIGADMKISCIGPGVDATHHYERTHVDALENTIKLLINYLV